MSNITKIQVIRNIHILYFDTMAVTQCIIPLQLAFLEEETTRAYF